MEEALNNETVNENEQVDSDSDLDRQELEQDMEQQIEQRVQERVEKILKERENKAAIVSEMSSGGLSEEFYDLLNLDANDLEGSIAKVKKCKDLINMMIPRGTGNPIVGRSVNFSSRSSGDLGEIISLSRK